MREIILYLRGLGIITEGSHLTDDVAIEVLFETKEHRLTRQRFLECQGSYILGSTFVMVLHCISIESRKQEHRTSEI